MPNYTFEDEDGKEFTIQLSLAEHEKFCLKNPSFKQIFTKVYASTIGSSMEWHMDHGIKRMWSKLDNQYRKSTGKEPIKKNGK